MCFPYPRHARLARRYAERLRSAMCAAQWRRAGVLRIRMPFHELRIRVRAVHVVQAQCQSAGAEVMSARAWRGRE